MHSRVEKNPGVRAGGERSPGPELERSEGATVSERIASWQQAAGNTAVTTAFAQAIPSPNTSPTGAGPLVHQALTSPGQPLEPGVRALMENRFGADFSDVRLHHGPVADQASRALDATAFTSGSHIVLAGGQTATPHLLEHELTHVLQQRHGPVPGTLTSDGLSVSHPGDPHEQAASGLTTAAPETSGAPAVPPDVTPVQCMFAPLKTRQRTERLRPQSQTSMATPTERPQQARTKLPEPSFSERPGEPTAEQEVRMRAAEEGYDQRTRGTPANEALRWIESAVLADVLNKRDAQQTMMNRAERRFEEEYRGLTPERAEQRIDAKAERLGLTVGKPETTADTQTPADQTVKESTAEGGEKSGTVENPNETRLRIEQERARTRKVQDQKATDDLTDWARENESRRVAADERKAVADEERAAAKDNEIAAKYDHREADAAYAEQRTATHEEAEREHAARSAEKSRKAAEHALYLKSLLTPTSEEREQTARDELAAEGIQDPTPAQVRSRAIQAELRTARAQRQEAERNLVTGVTRIKSKKNAASAAKSSFAQSHAKSYAAHQDRIAELERELEQQALARNAEFHQEVGDVTHDLPSTVFQAGCTAEAAERIEAMYGSAVAERVRSAIGHYESIAVIDVQDGKKLGAVVRDGEAVQISGLHVYGVTFDATHLKNTLVIINGDISVTAVRSSGKNCAVNLKDTHVTAVRVPITPGSGTNVCRVGNTTVAGVELYGGYAGDCVTENICVTNLDIDPGSIVRSQFEANVSSRHAPR
ncbi:DUF4157 domain-containing protein [Streptomyces sp. NPDC007861]|uniref:eCIS core domain-containing protein n=1 Tax=Streptomyces sp. NPDC007861 TaxID=3154893 RepID=UPI0034093946